MQAFEALRGFFKGSWYKGLRTVLVVPGRGRNSPDGMGVLREKLQSWLTQDPFKRVVLAFCTAQPHRWRPGQRLCAAAQVSQKRPYLLGKNACGF